MAHHSSSLAVVFAGVVATILIGGFQAAAGAPMDAEFEVNAWSGSSGSAQAILGNGHLVLADRETPNAITFELTTPELRLRVWEITRLHVGAANYTYEPYQAQPSLIDERSFRDAKITLEGVHEGWFVGALDFESAVVDEPREIQILRPMDGVRLAGVKAFRLHSEDGFEPFAYAHSGVIQPLFFRDFDAMINDPTHVVVMNGTLAIETSSGTQAIDPYRDYPQPSTPFAQTLRWLTMDVVDADVGVSLDVVNEAHTERMWYAQNAHFRASPDFWIDNSSGTVMVNSAIFDVDGSRLVAHGNLSYEISSTDRMSPGTYSVRLNGDVTRLSITEGQIVDSGGAALAAAAAVGLGALLVMAFREFVARAIGAVSIPLYTKLRKPNLLDHDRRQSLYDSIKEEPGVTFLQLHQRLQDEFGRAGGFGFGALTYHLSQLERFGLIVSKREGRFRRYFENGGKFGRDTKRIAILQTPPVPSVVEILLEEPGASQTRIHEHVAQTYPVTRQAVGYHLKRLQKQELLDMRRAGKANAYFPTPKLEELAEYAHANTASLRELQAERSASG